MSSNKIVLTNFDDLIRGSAYVDRRRRSHMLFDQFSGTKFDEPSLGLCTKQHEARLAAQLIRRFKVIQETYGRPTMISLKSSARLLWDFWL